MLLFTYTLSVISGDAGDASSGFSGDAGGVRSLFVIFRMSASVRIFPSDAPPTFTQQPFLYESYMRALGFTSVLQR